MATCLWVWLKWSHGLFDKNPHGSAEASRSTRQWIELGTQVFFKKKKYLLWTADATGKQETKHYFLSTSGFTTATQVKRVPGFFVPRRWWCLFAEGTPQKKKGWQRQSRLAGYSTIKITRGEKIMSLTLIHVTVKQLCNGLLLKWPLAFPLNRCWDDASDATETEITYNVKGHQAVVRIKSIGNSLNSSEWGKHPRSCGRI